jgi:Tol biopolymer transport system component
LVVDLRDGNTAGAPRPLTNDHQNKYSPVWTSDGREIVYLAGEAGGLMRMYRVRASGGVPARVEGFGDYPRTLTTAAKVHRLIYSRSLRDYNIWRIPLEASGNPAGVPSKLLASTRDETSPAYSPDGKRIAFTSNRTGVNQVWVADADGSNPVVLTNFPEGTGGSPKWSPDGQTLVYDGRPEGLADIYSIPAEGGTPKRLTDHSARADDAVPCYSADGRWIYFNSKRSGQPQLYRIPANGGEAVQITRKGGGWPAASPDGKWIYYSKPQRGIWRVPADGGEEIQILAVPSIYGQGTFCIMASGIYFAGARDPASGTIPLKLYRFADAKTVELGRFDKPLAGYFSVSPDEKWLAYGQLDSSVDDLMLVENFR